MPAIVIFTFKLGDLLGKGQQWLRRIRDVASAPVDPILYHALKLIHHLVLSRS